MSSRGYIQAMKFYGHILIFVALFGVLQATPTKQFYSPVRNIIIDSDAGGDDAVAIALALGAEKFWGNVSVLGITTVRGNTHVDNVVINVLKTLKTANRLDVPVFKGLNDSLLITPPGDNFFGNDGFGDFDFPDAPSADLVDPRHAVTFLQQITTENPNNITLVCIGPLTNIAAAVRFDPQFLNRLADIYILGGSTRGEGNIRPGIEFNVYEDPEATAIVFNAAKLRVDEGLSPIQLISWEASVRTEVPLNWRVNELGALNSSMIKLINKAEAITLNGQYWVFSDSIAVAAAIDNSWFAAKKTDVDVNVETTGTFSRGTLFVDYTNVLNDTKQIVLLEKLDTAYIKSLFLTLLNY